MFNLAPVGMGRATFRLQEIIQIGLIPSLILTFFFPLILAYS